MVSTHRETLTNRERYNMSKSNFIALCNTYYIDPAIALDNEELCEALRASDNGEVERILMEEF